MMPENMSTYSAPIFACQSHKENSYSLSDYGSFLKENQESLSNVNLPEETNDNLNIVPSNATNSEQPFSEIKDVQHMEEEFLIENQNAGQKIVVLDIDILNPPILSPLEEQIEYTESLSVRTNEDITIQEIKLDDLINGDNPMWEEVLKKYKSVGTLSKKHRSLVVDGIIQYARVKNIYIDLTKMAYLSCQIKNVFPTESEATYFILNGKKPSGKLYHRYHFKRKEDLQEEKERKEQEEIENEKRLEAAYWDSIDSISLLKNDEETDESYTESWEKTFVYRQMKISKYQSFDDFLNEFPIIAKPIGSFLIDMDFKKIHGNRKLSASTWNSFFVNNWTLITKSATKNGNGIIPITFYKKVQELEESSSKDAAFSILLHYLLPPAYGRSKWKPTILDSQNTFLKYIKDECVDTEICNSNKDNEDRGIQWFPYIIGHGPSNLEMKYFYVIIHNTKFETQDFLSALDLCMKIFILLNIPY